MRNNDENGSLRCVYCLNARLFEKKICTQFLIIVFIHDSMLCLFMKSEATKFEFFNSIIDLEKIHTTQKEQKTAGAQYVREKRANHVQISFFVRGN